MGAYSSTLVSLALLPGLCAEAKIPVILDTDIGGDIDDTWALAFLLASPEVDLQLVVTDSHNTVGKAKIVAKFLERVGRPDIPVGIGLQIDDEIGPQAPWAVDYDLARYPGRVYEDGVNALIEHLLKAPEKITLLSIGPVPNLRLALEREPRIVEKARLVAMAGGVYKQYGGQPGRCAEYNVKADIPAAQQVFSAPWDITLAPLDTAGVVCLTGEPYRRVRDAHNPLTEALLENYRLWSQDPQRPQEASSILFDTVAAYLTFRTDWIALRDLPLQVNDQGETIPAEDGKIIHTAVEWTDLEAFQEFLANRLCQGVAAQ